MTLRRTAQLVTGTGALLGGLAVLVLPSPYVIESPGPLVNTIGEVQEWPVISVDGAETYETEGSLSLTTVYVSGAPTSTVRVPTAVYAWVSPTSDMLPHELVHPSGTTDEDIRQRNTQAMAASYELALAAALDYLGTDYTLKLSVLEFTDQAREAGTDEILAHGDQILSAQGEEITGIEGLRNAVNEAAGQPLELTVARGEDQIQLEVPTYQEADGEYYVGLMLASEFDFPVELDIRVGEVGGPSAGLMFALGIIDTLTEESLTGGEDFAGTGTVDPDGTVGAIGGIAQKVVGARERGVEHFLAPRDNCDELTGRTPDGLTVYGVEDVAEAVRIVEAVRDNDEDFLAGLEPCGTA
ncbi:YlbL family protein [Nesterenkonia flava]|uniref:endopeptidase La n=1 Tax=Nesterenkonia flava TaxID=469799 RepID=A0ABU1FQC8_9MICC|nr:S16 family serine protease [Nesterenkonia flava]MDR5710835.1 S16 family serine protease [Nesterenkonia flava]